jgi:hypothetical protein
MRFLQERLTWSSTDASSMAAQSESAAAAQRDPSLAKAVPGARSPVAEMASLVAAPDPATQRLAPQAAKAAPAAQRAKPAKGSNESAANAESSGQDKISVKLDVRPIGSEIYSKGRYVGTAPLVIELAPGDKRVLEVNKRGYAPRRVVVDGRKTRILLGLKRLPDR